MANFTQKMVVAAPKPLKNIYDDYSVFILICTCTKGKYIFIYSTKKKYVLDDCFHAL